jgi:predicted NBD/HSP70 family sugar kinase
MALSPNERRILDVIWRQGPVARAEIAGLVDLTTGSVTRITQTLLQQGLLVESILHDGGRGTPSRPLSIAAGGAFAFGVSFSHRYMDVGLLDLTGRLIGSVRRRYADAKPEIIRRNSREAVSALALEYAIDPDRVAGIGFAIPGDFSPHAPFILAHPFFPHLVGVDLARVLSTDMPYPVFIENDCNSAALGERILGYGRQFRTFISVFVCHGIGGGIIIDGTLYRGTHGNAGGLHAFFPISQPRPSGHDLFDTMSREGVAVRDFLDFEPVDAIDLPGVRPWLSRAGKQLRDALSIVARVFDPDAIIIGGRLPPTFLQALAHSVDDEMFCANAASAKPVVRASELGPQAGIVGAAAVALYARYLDPEAATQRDGD